MRQFLCSFENKEKNLQEEERRATSSARKESFLLNVKDENALNK